MTDHIPILMRETNFRVGQSPKAANVQLRVFLYGDKEISVEYSNIQAHQFEPSGDVIIDLSIEVKSDEKKKT